MFSNMLTLEEVALTNNNIAFIKRCFCTFSSQQASQVQICFLFIVTLFESQRDKKKQK